MEISTAAYRLLIVAPLPSSRRHVVHLFFPRLGNDNSFRSQHPSRLVKAKDLHPDIPEWAEMSRACILRQLGRCADHSRVLSLSRCGSETAPWSRPLRRGLIGALRTIYSPPSTSIGSSILTSRYQTPQSGHSPSPAPGNKHGTSNLHRRHRSTRTHITTPPLMPCPSPNSCAP